jgi:hypothetical protein
VRLQSRLSRLEREAALRDRTEPDGPDPWEDAERRTAYLRGEGPCPPYPPCPSCRDPVMWASRTRIWRCLGVRISGELPDNQYLADMDEKERVHIDKTFAILAEVAREQRELVDRAADEAQPPGGGW